MAHGKPSANPNDFILPDLGEGVHEAELIKWRVKVGDAVAEHDILAEMETDKALVEVPSPRAGTIATLHGTEGEILKVGNPLVTYVGDAAGVVEPKAPAPAASPHASPTSNGRADERREDAGTVVGTMSGAAAGISAAPGKALATPAVRRLARDLGVDIDRVSGTGIGGRVLEKDVRASATSPRTGARTPEPAAKPSRAPEPPRRAEVERSGELPDLAAASSRSAAPVGESSRVPFRGVRRTIANRLRQSVDRAVHFNVMDEADVSALDTLRRKLASASGEKVSFLPFVASAACRVLTTPEFRSMNACVDENPDDESYEASIVQHRAVNLGIATDTESGLMVPVIRDADAMGVLELARAIAALATAARDRSIARDRLVGSTFTISNVGSHAGRFATPVINYPEVAILAAGRARSAPVVRGGGLFVGTLLPLSLACDHRVVDGATAALALARITELLQDPERLLAPARGS